MMDSNPLAILLASHDPILLAAMEPVLAASGARVEIVLSAEAALTAMNAPRPPGLALLDVDLPGMATGQLLAAARASAGGHRFPIVLISDTVTEEWTSRLAEGVLDDLIPRAVESPHGRLRLDMVLRTHHRMRDLDILRETAALHAQTDPLTGVYNRATLLSMLFRETDRVQRMKTPLCLLLFDIDDFGHWNSRLGADLCDDLLCQAVERTTRLLRSYDLLGRPGKDEFLLVLPGCASVSAVMLAERLRLEVFSAPFHVAGTTIRLSACFGIASSEGRSPVVVLREAEQALQQAKEAGPESIQCFTNCADDQAAPVGFLSPSSGDELLAW
ncbi:MAG: GGDEF domain-containing response regulator [Terracidiphilus sp.]